MYAEDKTTNPQKILKGVLASAIVALFCAFVFAALSVYGFINVGAARLLLVGAWLIGVGGVTVSEVVWGGRPKAKVLAPLIVGIVLAFSFYRLDIWAHDRPSQESKTLTIRPLDSYFLETALPMWIGPRATTYIVWLSPKENRVDPIPNETPDPIRVPLVEQITRENDDDVNMYQLINTEDQEIRAVKLTFDLLFIAAKKTVRHQRERSARSFTVPFQRDALGLGIGKYQFSHGKTTNYEPGDMLFSRRQDVEVSSIKPHSRATIFFVNKGTTFVRPYFPKSAQIMIEGISSPQIVSVLIPLIDEPKVRVSFGSLGPVEYKWGSAAVEKPSKRQ